MTASMNISLPETLRDFVKERVESNFHGTTSAYIKTLINEDRKRAAHERLEALILDGLNSGAPTPFTKTDVDDVRANVKARLLANKTV